MNYTEEELELLWKVAKTAFEKGFNVEITPKKVEITFDEDGDMLWNYSYIGEGRTTESSENDREITLERLYQVVQTGKFVRIQ